MSNCNGVIDVAKPISYREEQIALTLNEKSIPPFVGKKILSQLREIDDVKPWCESIDFKRERTLHRLGVNHIKNLPILGWAEGQDPIEEYDKLTEPLRDHMFAKYGWSREWDRSQFTSSCDLMSTLMKRDVLRCEEDLEFFKEAMMYNKVFGVECIEVPYRPQLSQRLNNDGGVVNIIITRPQPRCMLNTDGDHCRIIYGILIKDSSNNHLSFTSCDLYWHVNVETFTKYPFIRTPEGYLFCDLRDTPVQLKYRSVVYFDYEKLPNSGYTKAYVFYTIDTVSDGRSGVYTSCIPCLKNGKYKSNTPRCCNRD